MVLLKTTEVVLAAVKEYLSVDGEDQGALEGRLGGLEVGSPIEHKDLITLSKKLLNRSDRKDKAWRLDALLHGTSVYVAPPPAKPETTAEYKALMQRLRKEEEQRQYERMLASTNKDPFGQTVPSNSAFNPLLSHGRDDPVEVDEATFQDINRQLTLIINVLVTVIASGITIWFAARYWSVGSRLSLALVGSLAIAIAEVVVYMGYIRRVQDAKTAERKKVEQREISETWVIQKSALSVDDRDTLRHRKGKHR